MLREILKCLFQKVQGFQPSSRLQRGSPRYSTPFHKYAGIRARRTRRPRRSRDTAGTPRPLCCPPLTIASVDRLRSGALRAGRIRALGASPYLWNRVLSSSFAIFRRAGQAFLPVIVLVAEEPVLFLKRCRYGRGTRKYAWPFGERQDRRSLRCAQSTIRSVVSGLSARMQRSASSHCMLDDSDAPSLDEKRRDSK